MKKNALLYFLLIILIFLGTISKTFTFLSLSFSFIISIIIGISFRNNNNYCICKYIISLLVLQNLVIGCGAHIFGNLDTSLKYLTQIPFLNVFVIWLFVFMDTIFKKKKIEKVDKYFLLLLISITSSLIINRGSVQAILLNVRNMTFFYMIYKISYVAFKSKKDIYDFIRFVSVWLFIILVVGIFLVYGGYPLYNRIGINEVYIAKGVGYLGKLDGRFTTVLIKKQFYRMGSIMYEPVNLAYFYAFGFLFVSLFNWTNNKFSKLVSIIVALTGLILTFGKGGYMIVFASYIFLIIENILNKIKIKKSNFNIRKYRITSIVVIFLLVFLSIFYYNKVGASARPHYWAIQRTWRSLLNQPYGYGLGTGGNAAKAFNENFISFSWLSTGGETAILSFAYQIGFQGIILFVLTLFSTRSIVDDNDDKFYKLSFYIPFILLGVGLLQDNTFTPQCISLIMIALGAISKLKDNNYLIRCDANEK